jgi:hypothetical protein
MEVHSTHTYIGKGLRLVYRNTTNQGVPCPLHKKPRGGAAAEQARHTTNPKGLMGQYISSLTPSQVEADHAKHSHENMDRKLSILLLNKTYPTSDIHITNL